MSRIEQIGGSVAAISPQSVEKSRETAEKHGLTYPVLSDKGNEVARRFGLVWTFSDELRQVYTELGLNVPEYNADGSWQLPLPATYVIDRNRKIRYAHVDVDHTNRAEPDEVIAALKECSEE